MLQNVGLSLAAIIGLMPLALLGILGLAAVVAVHELAEIVIIGNGVRAGRTKQVIPRLSPEPGAGDLHRHLEAGDTKHQALA
ncbi:hypothetical protein ACFVTF_06320 [Kitasatospora sp. NPDC057940]|uniref:hypothetical protein n=1 Tax=Kitasatospora sp. NPDC057940 TaxID=3346285 RepID=UPI0036DC2074